MISGEKSNVKVIEWDQVERIPITEGGKQLEQVVLRRRGVRGVTDPGPMAIGAHK